MLKSNIAVGLDIGTTKVCVVVAEKDELGTVSYTHLTLPTIYSV